jgi:peptidoglycan/xylan/chitin deacetylase (PgdA/CDA1 family)
MRKQVASFVTNSGAFARFVALLEQVDHQPANVLRVLTYHRVCQPQPGDYGRVTVTPQQFDRQMAFLAAHYRVIAMPELWDAYQRGTALPPRTVLITFDDAYCDFAEHAWPTLQRYGLPATLFVPTAFPDRTERVFWWDWLYRAVSTTRRTGAIETPCGEIDLTTPAQRERAFSRLRDYVKTLPHEAAMAWVGQFCTHLDVAPPVGAVLGWQALRQLAAEGVTLGAHTQTHPLMDRLSPADMYAEAVGSLYDLEREIGPTLPIFAYPSGGFNEEAVRVLQQAGFALAFTTGRGLNRWATADHLRLRRINIGQRTTLPLMRAQMLSMAMNLNWQ